MKDCIAFEIPLLEVDFIKPIVVAFHERYPHIKLILVTEKTSSAESITVQHPDVAKCGKFTTREEIIDWQHAIIRVFVTPEQYRGGIEKIPSYCAFHGQPSKGLTMKKNITDKFDGFFLLGPLQKQAIQEFYLNNYGEMPSRPALYEIGYPKSDDLINGKFKSKRIDIYKELNFENDRPIILYAPAFNEFASMRENGIEIIERLISNKNWNIVVKLAVDCNSPVSNIYATGGINWFDKLSVYEKEKNFCLYKKTLIDPLLEIADVLVTCVSSVSFEFMVLGKPVIFFHTPKFFSHYLKMIFPHDDTENWSKRTTVNGGREYGVVVKNVDELQNAVENALQLGIQENKIRFLREKIIYNPGTASDVAAEKIKELFDLYDLSKYEKVQQLISLWRVKCHHIKSRMLRITKKLVKIVTRRKTTTLSLKQTYINCYETVSSAESLSMSVNDYLESIEDHPKKKGRRNRIINEMQKRGLLDIKGKNVLEIGTGTGRFLEKVIEYCPPKYEVYETDQAWCEYLKKEYEFKNKTELIIHDAGGVSFNNTPNNSVDMVHAHAVFVYLPIVTAIGYLREIDRVLKPGGMVCFDWYYDTDWSLLTFRAWEYKNMRFPVIVSRTMIENCFKELNFVIVDEFKEIYGASFSRYIILRKNV